MQPLIQNAAVLQDYELELEFTNSERRVFDVKPYHGKGIFTQLKDRSYFAQ